MAQGFAFVSHDQADENGVRAEVYVQKGTGAIKRITPSENGKVAQIQISTEGLKYPQSAWIQTDTPQYKAIQEAYDTKSTIEYRIESQRLPKNKDTKEPILRDTPISELRVNTETAIASTKSILAGVNGELTDERLTHPKEDPAGSGRRPAEDPDVVQARNAANNPASAPQQNHGGNQGHSNNRNNFRGGFNANEESPPYKEFNEDSEKSLNIGSYKIQAVMGAELFVRKQIHEGADENLIVRYASILLSIADKIQAYITRKPANRMASSHTRARSLVYDIVESIHPIPTDQSQDAEWVSIVGKITVARFTAVMQLATAEPFDLGSLSGSTQQNAPGQQLSSKKDAAVPAKSMPNTATNKTPEPEHVEVDNATIEASRPKANAKLPDSKALADMLANAQSYELYPPVDLSTVADKTKISEETMDVFKEFVAETKAPFGELAKLLNYTFGVSKASEVPDEVFNDFLEFYIAAGDENFIEVLKNIDNLAV